MVLWTIIGWRLLVMQNPGPSCRPAESESALLRVPQWCMCTLNLTSTVWVIWWQTKGAILCIKSYLTSDLKHETNTLLSYIIQIFWWWAPVMCIKRQIEIPRGLWSAPLAITTGLETSTMPSSFTNYSNFINHILMEHKNNVEEYRGRAIFLRLM